MKDSLNVVAVGIEDESAVVARMVRTLSRRTVVSPTSRERSAVKGMHCLVVCCLEGQVNTRHVSISLVDKELVSIEEACAFDDDIRQAERSKDSGMEALAGLDVRDPEVHVIEQPTAMKQHG